MTFQVLAFLQPLQEGSLYMTDCPQLEVLSKLNDNTKFYDFQLLMS